MNPSERIDQLIAEFTDRRGKTFASIRKSILEADREIIEEWKWMGSPVWSHEGIMSVSPIGITGRYPIFSMSETFSFQSTKGSKACL
jgi:hypothetical protein